MSNETKPMKGARRLVIDDHIFWYYVGKFNVVIWTPDGDKKLPVHFEALGGNLDDTEAYRAFLVDPGEYAITPGLVVEWIRSNIMENE